MKKTLSFFAIFSIAIFSMIVLFSSCEGTDDMTSSLTGYDKGKLSQEIFADETEGKGAFAFTASEAWNISIDEKIKTATDNSWITVSPMNGEAGEHTITIKLEINYTGEDRVAKINIHAGGSTIAITVEQKGTTAENEKPDAHKVILSLEGHENDYSLFFKYNSKWQVTTIENPYQDEAEDGSIVDYVDIMNLTYTNDQISWEYLEDGEDESNYDESITHKLNDKGFVSEMHSVYEDYVPAYKDETSNTYIYNNEEYLTKISTVRTGNDLNYVSECFVTWSNDNMTKIVETVDEKAVGESYSSISPNRNKFRTRAAGGGGSVYTTTISHTNFEDKTNVNLLFSTINLGNSSEIGILIRKLGKSSKNLISECKRRSESSTYWSEEIYQYSYTMDEGGYPTKVVETSINKWGDHTGDFNEEKPGTNTYIITYNK